MARLLESMGFVEDSQQRIARNQNRYFATRWQYQSRYQHDASLRPYLSLELTVRSPQFATARQPLDYLVERLASRSRLLGQIECVAVEETLAEKVISFCADMPNTVRVPCIRTGIGHWSGISTMSLHL